MDAPDFDFESINELIEHSLDEHMDHASPNELIGIVICDTVNKMPDTATVAELKAVLPLIASQVSNKVIIESC